MKPKHSRKHKKLKISALLAGALLLGIGAGYLLQRENILPQDPVATLISTVTHENSSVASTTSSTSQKLPADPMVHKPIPADNYENLSKTVVSATAEDLHQELITQDFIGTALIIKDGKIVLNHGYGFSDFASKKLNSATSHYQIGSIQKSFTAVLVAKLVQEGKLTYDTPLSKFFPAIANSQKITISDMLHMTSGLNISASPQGLTDQQELLSFYLSHITSRGPGKSTYAAINYFLLANIIQQLTQKSYYEVFKETYSNAGLQHFGFYTDWATQQNRTTSYKATDKADDYSQPIEESAGDFARELGTGNVDMPIGDLYWYYHQLTTGKIISSASLQQLWALPGNTIYIAGQYDDGDHYRAHGNEEGQRAMVLMTKDLKNGVILMSNRESGKLYNTLIEDLFAKVSGIQTKF